MRGGRLCAGLLALYLITATTATTATPEGDRKNGDRQRATTDRQGAHQQKGQGLKLGIDQSGNITNMRTGQSVATGSEKKTSPDDARPTTRVPSG